MTRTRVPQIDLRSLLADHNRTPSIDLRLKQLDDSMRIFLNSVAAYKERSMTQILERRRNQEAEKKKLEEKSQAALTETNSCKLKEIELVADLEREQEERKEAELAVTGLRRQVASLREKSNAVEAEIEQLSAFTSNLQRERDDERSTLDSHSSSLLPKLRACEEELSMVIEGVQKDRLLIRFANIDTANVEREFSLVIDVSSPDGYRVLTSTPLLPSLPPIIDQLNESNDLGRFISLCRQSFVNLVKD